MAYIIFFIVFGWLLGSHCSEFKRVRYCARVFAICYTTRVLISRGFSSIFHYPFSVTTLYIKHKETTNECMCNRKSTTLFASNPRVVFIIFNEWRILQQWVFTTNRPIIIYICICKSYIMYIVYRALNIECRW